ncbi:hypothetical protein [Deinococcus sp. QL22]|uniref:hypothetical protein n=1 Tax=Deinococcus sp. QL22 TaxID=2939437 RepID=UPI002017BFBB|nr:hypothetical protein [Deinococcus sp. QL22]UQN06528.1 hypothetical protein M1R55_01000 [Deinococcus sp. QL22]
MLLRFSSVLWSALLLGSAAAAPLQGLPSGTILQSSHADLGMSWWLWAVTAPEGASPVEDLTGEHCAVNQEPGVWFLAGSYQNGTLVERRCSLPAQTPVFFPVMNIYAAGETQRGCNAVLRQGKAGLDRLKNLRVTLDGQAVEGAARGRMEACTYLEEAELWFGSDGWWMALNLPTGAHTLAFSAEQPGFKQNLRYELSVR